LCPRVYRGMAQVIEITLTEEQRQELEAIVARPFEGAGLVRRARVILLSARGVSGREIALRLDLTPEHVSVIRARFRDEGVAGLHERPKSGRTDHAVAPATVEKIVQLAMSPPPAGAARPPRCLHACLEQVADSVRVDEAGGRDHQVTPSDAEAHLDGGALVRGTPARSR
jgi:Helix-turn-helix domain